MSWHRPPLQVCTLRIKRSRWYASHPASTNQSFGWAGQGFLKWLTCSNHSLWNIISNTKYFKLLKSYVVMVHPIEVANSYEFVRPHSNKLIRFLLNRTYFTSCQFVWMCMNDLHLTRPKPCLDKSYEIVWVGLYKFVQISHLLKCVWIGRDSVGYLDEHFKYKFCVNYIKSIESENGKNWMLLIWKDMNSLAKPSAIKNKAKLN